MNTRLGLGLLCLFGILFSVGCGSDGTSTPITPNQQQVPRVPFLSVSYAYTTSRTIAVGKPYRLLKPSAKPSYSWSGTTELYTVRTDGTDLRQITNIPGWFDDVSITPDFKTIVFMHYPPNGNLHIDKVDVDGNNNVAVSTGEQNEGWPVVTPRGDKIYYTDMAGTYYQLYRMNLDGTQKERVLNLPEVDQYEVNISPDGNRIVLDMDDVTGTYHGTYVVRLDGSAPVKVANWEDVPFGDATFNADGSRIMYTIYDGAWYQIVSVDLTGSDLRQHTSGLKDSVHPLMFGNKLVFMGSLSDVQLYSTDATWANPLQITTGTGYKTFHVRLVYN